MYSYIYYIIIYYLHLKKNALNNKYKKKKGNEESFPYLTFAVDVAPAGTPLNASVYGEDPMVDFHHFKKGEHVKKKR